MLFLQKVSALWARTEIVFATVFAGAITALILLNVITRALDQSIYWVDEAAIYSMAWMTFLAASSSVHYGHSVTVSLLVDFTPERVGKIVTKCADFCVFLFAVAMVFFCWRWYRPDALIAAGFDVGAFQSSTFNFIYAEPTTLRIHKAWIWSVMWFFSLGMLLHSSANLCMGMNSDRSMKSMDLMR
ncbi:MAG: TRAP transporter small permease subunit [Gammaproteobacteria bacterium]|nr:TRAP transporter small permease subunit [Gammaproteobacteria bacterium]